MSIKHFLSGVALASVVMLSHVEAKLSYEDFVQIKEHSKHVAFLRMRVEHPGVHEPDLVTEAMIPLSPDDSRVIARKREVERELREQEASRPIPSYYEQVVEALNLSSKIDFLKTRLAAPQAHDPDMITPAMIPLDEKDPKVVARKAEIQSELDGISVSSFTQAVFGMNGHYETEAFTRVRLAAPQAHDPDLVTPAMIPLDDNDPKVVERKSELQEELARLKANRPQPIE